MTNALTVEILLYSRKRPSEWRHSMAHSLHCLVFSAKFYNAHTWRWLWGNTILSQAVHQVIIQMQRSQGSLEQVISVWVPAKIVHEPHSLRIFVFLVYKMHGQKKGNSILKSWPHIDCNHGVPWQWWSKNANSCSMEGPQPNSRTRMLLPKWKLIMSRYQLLIL